MKKLIFIVAAALMTAAIPLPVFAESPEQPSETQAPVLKIYTILPSIMPEMRKLKTLKPKILMREKSLFLNILTAIRSAILITQPL